VILLDTHIWVWWVHDPERLPKTYKTYIEENESEGLGVSIMSCWEVAKLTEYGRLVLPTSVAEWFDQALSYPGIRLLELTPRIVVESTKLPGTFHRDPADQLIVASARIFDCPLITVDEKILSYAHVQLAPKPAG
jgi:PIN domain nuclease of toxin-antitoxin system